MSQVGEMQTKLVSSGGVIAAAALMALVGLFAIVPAAQAAKGVYGAFGKTGIRGGEFNSNASIGVSGVAVNSSGAGAASPGDVYVLDRGNNRVQRFTFDGAFLSAFGQDVTENGGANTGFEICTVAASCKVGITGGTGGALSTASSLGLSGIAVDQTSGDIYITDRGNRRGQRFDAEGNFLRTFGKNVVASGSEQADEQQRLTVDAAAGQYKLTFNAQTTGDLEFNASAASVQSALEALASIGAGNVTVTGGPGSAGGGTPYLISFGGALADTDLAAITVSAGTTPLSGGTGAAVAVFNDGAVGYEVCTVAANCQGSPSNAATGGAFNTVNLNSLAIAPAGALNVGNVLVADGGNNRIQEFTPSGAFVRAFGWDTVESGPGNTAGQFEVCRVAALDICKAGVAGSGSGQFAAGSPSTVAEDSSGNVYVTESTSGFRVQKFTLPGNVVTPQGSFCGTGPAPGELCGTGAWNGPSNTPIAIAVDTSTVPGTPGTIYLVKYFPAGSGAPPLASREGEVLQVDPLTGEVTDKYLRRAGAGPNTSLNSLALNTATGRLYVPDPPAPILIIDEMPPIAAALDPAEAGATTATLKGTVTPAQLPNLDTFYFFEYARAGSGLWKRAPLSEDVNIGHGSLPVAVSQNVEGLEINACYDLRLVTYSKYRGAEEIREGQFCTQPIAPQVSTGAARWSSPPATGPSLTFHGTLNAGKDDTTYVFQYVTQEGFEASGFGSASQVPLLPASAGHGLFQVAVLQSVVDLDSSKAYAYRILATNSVGTTEGETKTVAPPQAEDRFYELVGNADSYGLETKAILAVSDDGQRAMLEGQAMGDPNSLPAQRTPFLARLGAGGWGVEQVNPFPESGRGEIGFSGSVWFPASLETALWAHSSPSEQIRGEVHWTFTDPDGAFRPALPKLVPVSGRATPLTLIRIKGTAADLSSFVFQREETTNGAKTRVTYLPGQPQTTGGDGDLYRVSGAAGPSPTMALLNRDSGGSLISNACGVWIGARMNPLAGNGGNANKGLSLRPVSSDGNTAYFSARPGAGAVCDAAAETANRIRIFKRIGDASTVEISACGKANPLNCTTNGDDFFQAASANGNRVFFTTTRQLTDSDVDSALDLYLYDSDPPAGQPHLVQASAKAGTVAEVQEAVTDVSLDGSRVYFVAKGSLTGPNGDGKSPVAGQFNLYVYQRDAANPAGRLGFVAKLDNGDNGAENGLWSVEGRAAIALPYAGAGGSGAGDGRTLLFASKAQLAAGDTDAVNDLYRYRDSSGQTSCLTCAGDGSFGVSVRLHGRSPDAAGPQRERFASEDLARVVFSSAEQLSPEDDNNVTDAYLWEEGGIELISTGEPASAGLSGPPLLSSDAAAAFFLTADRILPSDQDSAADAYSARIGGGFPETASFQSCVSADACRTAPVAPPAVPGIESIAPGAGNPTYKPPCKKGQVRKKGKCVKKAKKKSAKKHKRGAKGGKKGGRR